MVEERFTRDGYKIWDNVKNEEFYELHYRHECEDMCDYLNEYEDKVNELQKENEQLKQKNMYFLKIIFALKNYVENEDYEQIEKAIDKIKKEMI